MNNRAEVYCEENYKDTSLPQYVLGCLAVLSLYQQHVVFPGCTSPACDITSCRNPNNFRRVSVISALEPRGTNDHEMLINKYRKRDEQLKEG